MATEFIEARTAAVSRFSLTSQAGSPARSHAEFFYESSHSRLLLLFVLIQTPAHAIVRPYFAYDCFFVLSRASL